LTIGHDTSSSKTFFPHFLKQEGSKVVFADVAGLQDTAGDLIDIINCLINKSIFNRASHICFLIPFTHGLIEESRGVELRK